MLEHLNGHTPKASIEPGAGHATRLPGVPAKCREGMDRASCRQGSPRLHHRAAVGALRAQWAS